MNPSAIAYLVITNAIGLTAVARGADGLATNPMALVVSIAVGAIVAVVTYSTLRRMQLFCRGSCAVIAGCGAVLATIGLVGGSHGPAEPGAQQHVVSRGEPLIHFLTIPWAALGLAVILMFLFVFFLRVLQRLFEPLRRLRESVGVVWTRIGRSRREATGIGTNTQVGRYTGRCREQTWNPPDRGRLR